MSENETLENGYKNHPIVQRITKEFAEIAKQNPPIIREISISEEDQKVIDMCERVASETIFHYFEVRMFVMKYHTNEDQLRAYLNGCTANGLGIDVVPDFIASQSDMASSLNDVSRLVREWCDYLISNL